MKPPVAFCKGPACQSLSDVLSPADISCEQTQRTSSAQRATSCLQRPELCRLIAKACGRTADDVPTFKRAAEGGWHRIFKVTLRGGTEVIARLLFPRNLPKFYRTLSEVATTTFLREHGLPVPKIYDWCATAENFAGSEYIIMEKAQGIYLHGACYSKIVGQRLDVFEKIVQLGKVLFDISFPACG